MQEQETRARPASTPTLGVMVAGRAEDEHSHRHPDGSLSGLRHRLAHLVTPHSHDTTDRVDPALAASREGLRALWISFVLLLLTAAAQAVVVLVTGSVALLSDTLHNLADALTAVPIAIAFLVGRRAATRRYTYGFGRAEDLAGLVVVVVIAASAASAAWAAIQRLREPQEIELVGAVAAAGFVGFLGNEAVARYRIRVGRRIGSAALVADGLHARTDGFTSLAVLLSALGVALGWPEADPIVGLVITVAILYVLRDAARQVWRRLMDAVEPELVDQGETILRGTPGVRDIAHLRLRWVGHELIGEATVLVDDEITLRHAHEIAEEAEHRLVHGLPRLQRVTIHTDPLHATHPAMADHRRDEVPRAVGRSGLSRRPQPPQPPQPPR
jgi:cation diffusion facilitator family transporter